MKILSISIAAYNCESTLEKCLDSMVNSKCVDELEIIVVNDGSKDNTLEIANRYAEKHPDSVFVVDKENGGHGSTINASVTRATGAYYKIVDSDDWVETENLEQLVSCLKNSSADLVVNSYYEFNPQNQQQNLVSSIDGDFEFNKTYNYESVALQFDKTHMHKLTFKTDLVKEMGPVIDENCFYVDVEYVGFLLSTVNTVCFLDYPVYDYLLGYDGQSVSIPSMIKRREQHKKVVRRMLSFYESIDGQSNQKEFLRRYVSTLVGRQYKIYLHMPIAEGKQEFVEFDKTVPDYVFVSPGMGKRMLPVVKATRMCHCAFYSVIAGLLKAMKLV